jgi:chromosome segregation ATPase
VDKHVLLVDADPAFAAEAARTFADADVALEAVGGEEEALSRARARKPDLVVLAAGDAPSLRDRLRATAGLSEVPVAILADDGANSMGPGDGSAAPVLVLPRPDDPDGLLAAVAPCLGIEIAAVGDDEILSVDDLAVDDLAGEAAREAQELPGAEVAELRAELSEGREALAELERTVVGLQKELHEEQGKVASLETKLADTEARAASLSEVVNESLAEREESDRAWTARLAQAEREAAAAREEADRARLEAAQAHGEAEAARREVAEARAETDAARAEADAAKIEAIVARGETEAANAEVEALRGELAEARAENEELSRELETAKAQLEELAGELGAVTAAAASAGPAAEVDALTARVAEAEERIAGLTGELAAARARNESLARELAEARAERGAGGSGAGDAAALARELAEVRADRERIQDELAAELANLAHDLAVKDGQVNAAKRRITRLEALAHKLQEERDRLAAAAKATPGGELALEVERLREELEELRNENAFLGTEVDRYAALATGGRPQKPGSGSR